MNIPTYIQSLALNAPYSIRTLEQGQAEKQARYEQLKQQLETTIALRRTGPERIKGTLTFDEEMMIDSIFGANGDAHADLAVKVLDNWDIDQKQLTNALGRAIMKRNFEMILLALQRGANVNYPGENLNSLHKILTNYHFDNKMVCYLAQLFLKYGANPNLQIDSEYTALMTMANTRCSKGLCRLFITSGADIDIKTSDGKTAMNIALQDGHLNRKEYMEKIASQRDNLFQRLQQGNKIAFKKRSRISRCHVRDIKGNNFLYHALLYGNKPVARKLLALWPELLLQKNFEGISIVDIMSNSFDRPVEAQKIVETLITCGAS